MVLVFGIRMIVSTHSRLKAAGLVYRIRLRRLRVSTHSRLKAAGALEGVSNAELKVSTHSRLKAAGNPFLELLSPQASFNTQPPEGGWD